MSTFSTGRETPIVRLTGDDLIEATRIGTARDDTLDIGRDPDTTGYHGSGSADSHILGVKGEMAVADYYNLPIDDETYAMGDGGTDFDVLYHGERRIVVDVKTTSYAPADLLVRADQSRADVYILAEYARDDAEVTIAGMATSDMVVQAENKEQSKYGHMNYRVARDDLREVPAPGELVPTDEVKGDV